MEQPKDNWMRRPRWGYISIAQRYIPLAERYTPPQPPDRGTRISRSKTLTFWVWYSYIIVGFFSFLWVKVAIDVIKVYIQ